MVFYHHHLCPLGEGINVAAFLKDFTYVLLNCDYVNIIQL